MKKLYSNLKIFHFQSKLNAISSGILSAPLHIRIKPTNKCNHVCYYCCYRNNNLHLSQLFNEKDEIPLGKMKEIISDFKKMNIGAVTFSGGGEPLFYSHIMDALKGFLSAKIKIAVLTNGSLLKGKKAQFLSRFAAWIRISMDAADAQTYAKVRRVGRTDFDKVCQNINNFAKRKNRNCQLGINFIVTKNNYNDVYKFLEIMKKLGVDHVKISESIVSVKRRENEKYHSKIMVPVREQIKKAILELSSNRFSIINKVDDFSKKDNSYCKKYKSCFFSQCLTVIGADMNVYSCQDKAYTNKGKLGSIQSQSFKEFWASNKAKEKIFKLNPSKHCNHHCTQHEKNLILWDYFDLNKKHLEFV